MQFYETAKDHYSLVRILCFNGNLERAVEVAEESGSRAAAYHLARRLSMENEVCGMGFQLWDSGYLSMGYISLRVPLYETFFIGCEESHPFLHEGSVLHTGHPACKGMHYKCMYMCI